MSPTPFFGPSLTVRPRVVVQQLGNWAIGKAESPKSCVPKGPDPKRKVSSLPPRLAH